MPKKGNELPPSGLEKAGQNQKNLLFEAIQNICLSKDCNIKLSSGDEFNELSFSLEHIKDNIWGERYDEVVLRYTPFRLVGSDVFLESAAFELIRRKTDGIVYSRSLYLFMSNGTIESDIENELYKEEMPVLGLAETEAAAAERLIQAYDTELALGLKTLTTDMAAEAISTVKLMVDIDKN